ncbi:glycosyltransferase [Lichenihabitans psoromatis]|uniref:glycosyltransferase n=1 Tax=Lichenihabitans psoromatis TaxID=2528642 RepID=UPI001036AE62|nr:glycosyltransferase [Lichenihabitans psoromatis]
MTQPSTEGEPERMRIFAHLAYGFDARQWEEKWRDGRLLGLNEPRPYGYHHAVEHGCDVVFSTDHAESYIGHSLRGFLRLVLGFDVLHAFRNRHAMMAADVIWTHTESQHLAVSLLLKQRSATHRPRLIAQSVWLIDGWSRLHPLRQRFYRWLIESADVLTFLSPVNASVASALFPGKPCEFVQFGIRADIQAEPRGGTVRSPLRILAVGNDRHRDWECLVAAFGNIAGFSLTIASQTIRTDLSSYRNIAVVTPRDNEALKLLYGAADLMVLPLKPNMHASGITVLQEAALFGLPTVASRVGGLDGYFRDDDVCFVEPGNPTLLRRAAQAFAANPQLSVHFASRAQARMRADDLGSRAYVSRHVALSHELLRGSRRRGEQASHQADERSATGSEPILDHAP